MEKKVIKNGKIINRGEIIEGDLLIVGDRIEQVGGVIDKQGEEIDATDCHVMPGIIDDQVHFREPGLTHKANIHTESKAACAGGVTTFMEMPNTKPPALTQKMLQDKYDIAARTAFTNYSFFMGASNDNLEHVLKTDPHTVCGIKAFMGSSTGNMLVDDPVTLEQLFSKVSMLIATHCEDEATIRNNAKIWEEKYGDQLHARHHPHIRNEEGCYLSSSLAKELAERHDTRLHILHISTAKELSLFSNEKPLEEKRITSEACVHHLYFCDKDYEILGNKIKCNPAIKRKEDRDQIFQAVLDGTIDIIATDHAPHTIEEKSQHYIKAPSGLPLVQHSLNIMLDYYHRGMITMEMIIQKMCHDPARCFRVLERGYLDEGNYADVVIFDADYQWEVDKAGLFYKCGWSPLEGKRFRGKVMKTLINGHTIYDQGEITEVGRGMRVLFNPER
ncbi:MAG: dihydroorotase [Saprospiraceae bacterium]|nr:dihydroorotase [Saprospiraceae bacterium]